MRISNPKTTAGGLPLATTWYVNKRFEGTKLYIDAVSSFLSGYTDQEVAAATQASILRDQETSAYVDAQDAAISGLSDQHDAEVISAFCKYITGWGANPSEFVAHYMPTLSSENPAEYYNFTEHQYGYAYLASNKKIATELMPDISILDVYTCDIAELFNYLKDNNYLAHDREFAQLIEANPTDLQTILGVVKKAIEAYVLANQSLDGAIKAFGQGDVFVITNFGVNSIAADLASDAYKLFKDVFSQGFMCGAWICSGETRKDNGLNATVKFVKISYNQGEIISVNNIIPTADGNVAMNLAQVHRVEGGDIGETLAKDIQKIKSIVSDNQAMNNVPTVGGVVDFLNVAERFVFDDEVHGCCYAYATVNEYMALNIAAAQISAAFDIEVARAKATEQFLSGAIDTEIDRASTAEAGLSAAIDYVSGVVGVEADLGGKTVTDALLAVKDYAETTEANINLIESTLNTTDFDVLSAATLVIPAGDITAAAAALAPIGIAVEAKSFRVEHGEVLEDPVYENDIYNFFGIARNASFTTPDIAEITINGIKGRVLDIYSVNGSTFEKVDTDISYVEGVATDGVTPTYTSKITILGEYDRALGTPETTVIDKLIVRYTNKFTYTPAEPTPLF